MDVSVTTQLRFSEYVEVPQLQFIDSMVGFPVASQRQGSQCKLCGDSPGAVLGLGHARRCATTGCRVSQCRKQWKYRKCSTLTGWSMFPLQFIDKVWTFLCPVGGASDSVHRESWVMTAVKWFFGFFRPFFALLRVVPELSASRSWGASGGALTPGDGPPGARPPVVHELVAGLAQPSGSSKCGQTRL